MRVPVQFARIAVVLAALVTLVAQPVEAQSNLHVSGCGLHVSLSWDRAPDGPRGPATYEVRVTADGSGQIVLYTLQVGAVTDVAGTMPVPGTYWLWVRMTGGAWVGPAFVDTSVVDGDWRLSAPPLRVEVNALGQVAFLWQPPRHGRVRNYLLEVITEAGQLLGRMDVGNRLVFETAGLPDGTNVATVRAQNACETGPPSDRVRFTVSREDGGPCAAPTAVQNLRANLTGRTVTLQWDPPAGGSPVQFYEVAAGTVPGGDDLADELLVTSTAITATLPPGRYFVAVEAVSVCGSVGPLAEIEIVVP